MSLSYFETEFTRGSLGLKRRLGEMRRHADHLKGEISSGFHEVASSPHVRTAALRVTSALVVSFGLVQLAKHLVT